MPIPCRTSGWHKWSRLLSIPTIKSPSRRNRLPSPMRALPSCKVAGKTGFRRKPRFIFSDSGRRLMWLRRALLKSARTGWWSQRRPSFYWSRRQCSLVWSNSRRCTIWCRLGLWCRVAKPFFWWSLPKENRPNAGAELPLEFAKSFLSTLNFPSFNN